MAQAWFERVWETAEAHGSAAASSVRFSPTEPQLATCAANGTITVWDQGGKPLRTLEAHLGGISAIDYSPNGKYLASASDDLSVRVWDTLGFGNVRILNSHTYHVTAVKFNSKSNIVVSASSDENIRIWDVLRARSMRTLSAHSEPVSSVDLSFDDTIVASGSHDGLIRLFDTETGACLKTLPARGGPISQVRFTPNARFVLAASLDSKITLWDYIHTKVANEYTGGTNTKYSLGLGVVSVGAHHCVYAGDELGNVLFWDVQSAQLLHTLHVGESPVMDVAFKGDLMATLLLDGHLTCWRIV